MLYCKVRMVGSLIIDVPFRNGDYREGDRKASFFNMIEENILADDSTFWVFELLIASDNLKHSIVSMRMLINEAWYVETTNAVIHTVDDWINVLPSIKTLVFSENSCNSINSDMYISNFPKLKTITVKKNALINLNSLTIRNNTQLETIIIEDGVSAEGGFHKVKTVVLQGDDLKWF